MKSACAQSQIRPTLGAQGRGQRRATLRRNGKRAPPVVAHRRTIQPSHAEPSSHFAEAQIHARLTNPAKQNIITSIRGSRRPVADFKSEPRPASNRNQWPASYWNAWPASSVSAACSNCRKRGFHLGLGFGDKAGLLDLRSGAPNANELAVRADDAGVDGPGHHISFCECVWRARCTAFRPSRPSVFVEMIELFVGRLMFEPSDKTSVWFLKAP